MTADRDSHACLERVPGGCFLSKFNIIQHFLKIFIVIQLQLYAFSPLFSIFFKCISFKW